MAGLQTPATVAARKAGIAFQVPEYEHDEASASYGLELAPADLAALAGATTARLVRG